MRAERAAAVQRYNECGSQGEHTGCREEAGNKMKRNGVAIRHFQRSSAGPQGKILHPDFRQPAQHLASSRLPP